MEIVAKKQNEHKSHAISTLHLTNWETRLFSLSKDCETKL
jgi:hypothetical protein